MRLSIIIPIYNRQDAGNRALRSVVTQKVAAEIIIVDDGSTPPFYVSPNINPAGIRIICLDENRGAAAARNVGFAAAKGEWVALLDSDDYWLPDTLKPRLDAAMRDFARDPNPMRCYAGGFVLANRITGKSEARIPIESSDPADFAGGAWYCAGSTILLHRESLKRVGDFDPALRRLEDFDWLLRFALAGGSLKVFDKIVAVIEIGTKVSVDRLAVVEEQLRNKYLSSASDIRIPFRLARRLKAYLDIEHASSLIAQREWITASYFLARSMIFVPRLSLQTRRYWTYPAVPEFNAEAAPD
jgi:glycosyltransferase involved in cell wall biosynthesis